MRKAQLFSPVLRRALRGACVVFLAMVLTPYISKTQTFWLTAIAALLTQTELGSPLQQGLRRFFWTIILLFVGGAIGILVNAGSPLIIVAATTLLAYIYAYHLNRYLGLPFSLLFLVVLLLILLLPASFLDPAYLRDGLVGAFLGLISTVLIFPDQPHQEFPKRLTPLLRDLSAYLAALVDLMLREPGAEQLAQHKRNLIERSWANKNETLPVWVFEAGFNPALKAGQYFFLVHLSRVVEILFALHHFARHPFPNDLLSHFAEPIRDSTRRTQELLANLTFLLEGKKLAPSETDFIQDFSMLEENFQSQIKLSLEVLDISRDYVYLAAFIRYLKELRQQLLQLAATLN